MQLTFPYFLPKYIWFVLKRTVSVSDLGPNILKYSKTLQLRSLINDYNYILAFTGPEELL